MYDNVYEIENYDFLDDDEDESNYSYDEIEDIATSESTEVFDLIQYCIKPTVVDAYVNLSKLFVLCLIYRTVIQFVRIPDFLLHLLSALTGIYALYIYFQTLTLHILLTTFYIYSLLCITSTVSARFRSYVIGIALMTVLVLTELFWDQNQWQKIRGPQMILVMKGISLAFDVDSHLIQEPNIFQFCGYVLNVGTCVFGPWVSYNEYKSALQCRIWNFKWLVKVAISLVLSLLFFTLSVCWIEWLIPSTSNPILLVYRDALLFRVGHYFVSYVSETTAVLTGFGGSTDVTWKLTVSKPLAIELPYSLVQVVVHWNIPMHKWLKTYVFRTTRRLGSFVAVMTTYLASAMLHGLNIRLAAVLLSLGLYTYIEYSFRNKLSQRFNACLTSRPCTIPCLKHKNSSSNLIVNTSNIFFTVLTMFHLGYLGILIDTSNSHSVRLSDAFTEWQNLKFISHWVFIATYVIYVFI